MWVSKREAQEAVKFYRGMFRDESEAHNTTLDLAQDLLDENDTLRAELTELNDLYESADEEYETQREITRLNNETADRVEALLRAELTELADALEMTSEFSSQREAHLIRVIDTWESIDNRKAEQLELLRAYATEAYEHGVSDGIDTGKAYGRQQGAKQATVDTLRRVQLAVREVENGEYS